VGRLRSRWPPLQQRSGRFPGDAACHVHLALEVESKPATFLCLNWSEFFRKDGFKILGLQFRLIPGHFCHAELAHQSRLLCPMPLLYQGTPTNRRHGALANSYVNHCTQLIGFSPLCQIRNSIMGGFCAHIHGKTRLIPDDRIGWNGLSVCQIIDHQL
jgi:hypothetical protein